MIHRDLEAKVLELARKYLATYRPKYFDTLSVVASKDLQLAADDTAVIYGGETSLATERGHLISFRDMDGFLDGAGHRVGP